MHWVSLPSSCFICSSYTVIVPAHRRAVSQENTSVNGKAGGLTVHRAQVSAFPTAGWPLGTANVPLKLKLLRLPPRSPLLFHVSESIFQLLKKNTYLAYDFKLRIFHHNFGRYKSWLTINIDIVKIYHITLNGIIEIKFNNCIVLYLLFFPLLLLSLNLHFSFTFSKKLSSLYL